MNRRAPTRSTDVVARLVKRDLPHLADRPLRRLETSGSSNVLFGLGTDLVVRMPRQSGGARSLETEADWLPLLAPALPVCVQETIALGDPGFGYPERWALVRWIDGDPLIPPVAPASGADALADDLAGFINALRATPIAAAAPADRRLRSYRSRPLNEIDAGVRRYLQQCRSLPDLQLDLDACADVWADAVNLPPSSERECWVHADLLAENLLLRGERLAAVLDFGALAIGDPSVDLVVAWEVFGPEARQKFRDGVPVDDATWLRGRGWALAIALMTFPYYWESMPARCAARLNMAQQVLADADRASA